MNFLHGEMPQKWQGKYFLTVGTSCAGRGTGAWSLNRPDLARNKDFANFRFENLTLTQDCEFSELTKVREILEDS